MEELLRAAEEKEKREFESNKNSLKVTALTQRISQLVANYEEQMAELRSDATLRLGQMDLRIQELKSELDAERAKNVSQGQFLVGMVCFGRGARAVLEAMVDIAERRTEHSTLHPRSRDHGLDRNATEAGRLSAGPCKENPRSYQHQGRSSH